MNFQEVLVVAIGENIDSSTGARIKATFEAKGEGGMISGVISKGWNALGVAFGMAFCACLVLGGLLGNKVVIEGAAVRVSLCTSTEIACSMALEACGWMEAAKAMLTSPIHDLALVDLITTSTIIAGPNLVDNLALG